MASQTCIVVVTHFHGELVEFNHRLVDEWARTRSESLKSWKIMKKFFDGRKILYLVKALGDLAKSNYIICGLVYLRPNVFRRIDKETRHSDIDQLVKVICHSLAHVVGPPVKIDESIKVAVVSVVEILVIVDVT